MSNLAPVPVRVLTERGEYDPVEEEPNLTIVIRCRRVADANGIPCSSWEYGWEVEGKWKAPLSEPQRDYAGALVRHISGLIQENPSGATEAQLVARIVRRYKAELRAKTDAILNCIAFVVVKTSTHQAARLLQMPESKIVNLLRARMPEALLPGAQANPDVLEQIARVILPNKPRGYGQTVMAAPAKMQMRRGAWREAKKRGRQKTIRKELAERIVEKAMG